MLGVYSQNPLCGEMTGTLIWFFAGVIVLVLVLTYLVPLPARRERLPESRWKAGIFYSNRDDPALFVPKRFGMGYTLNFGNSRSWAVLAVITLLLAAPLLLAVLFLRQIDFTSATERADGNWSCSVPRGERCRRDAPVRDPGNRAIAQFPGPIPGSAHSTSRPRHTVR